MKCYKIQRQSHQDNYALTMNISQAFTVEMSFLQFSDQSLTRDIDTYFPQANQLPSHPMGLDQIKNPFTTLQMKYQVFQMYFKDLIVLSN